MILGRWGGQERKRKDRMVVPFEHRMERWGRWNGMIEEDGVVAVCGAWSGELYAIDTSLVDAAAYSGT